MSFTLAITVVYPYMIRDSPSEVIYSECLDREVKIARICVYSKYNKTISTQDYIGMSTNAGFKIHNLPVKYGVVSNLDNQSDKFYYVPESFSRRVLTMNMNKSLCYYEIENNNIYYETKCIHFLDEMAMKVTIIASMVLVSIFTGLIYCSYSIGLINYCFKTCKMTFSLFLEAQRKRD
jgi:hypothetical protein